MVSQLGAAVIGSVSLSSKALLAAFWCGHGQYMLFTRDAYKELGSHRLVKDHLE
jgi:hypothetical protein